MGHGKTSNEEATGAERGLQNGRAHKNGECSWHEEALKVA